MSFIRVYIVGYFVLIAGALLALWQADILGHIPLVWIAIGLIIAIGLGIILAVDRRETLGSLANRHRADAERLAALQTRLPSPRASAPAARSHPALWQRIRRAPSHALWRDRGSRLLPATGSRVRA